MKKALIFILLLCFLCSFICITLNQTTFAASDDLVKSYYVMEYDTGAVLSKYNENEKRPIASMVKIMTLILCFDAIEKGDLKMDQKLVVSETASGMGGSQMFLDANTEYYVRDLIKGVVICSANDAAVALGEAISGSVEAFVNEMNEYAKKLGMKNTKFCNTTGLPGGEQYSTAKDVTLMTRKLLSYKDYYKFSTIWMEDFVHPDGRKTQMVNTNKLVRFYQGCDSGKTGFTNDAMFCLSASAKRKDMRVITTVLGGVNSKARFKKVADLFNYAFANYEQKVIFRAGESIPNKLKIRKSKYDNIDIYAENDIKIFSDKKTKVTPEIKITLKEGLKAPMKADSVIGTISVCDKNGQELCSANLRLKYDVKKQNLLDAMRRVLKNWSLK
ncbi:MAG: D-alanyl-D-alanine carboxypeptidase family protein [Christensenellales bacterium]|jgi:D-alanyl-D-alanine carboxypeptidase (penicillin-binding protein 5/6)|nr:D-alanyl-D-alanine carboxypeptidase [Clostridiales bacterium]